jgi:hypothetical protein
VAMVIALSVVSSVTAKKTVLMDQTKTLVVSAIKKIISMFFF